MCPSPPPPPPPPLPVLLLQRDVTYEEAKQFADENGLLFLETSAKTLVCSCLCMPGLPGLVRCQGATGSSSMFCMGCDCVLCACINTCVVHPYVHYIRAYVCLFAHVCAHTSSFTCFTDTEVMVWMKFSLTLQRRSTRTSKMAALTSMLPRQGCR